FAACLVAGVLFAGVDASIGLRAQGTSIEGDCEHAIYFGYALQSGLVLAFGAGLALAILQLLLRRVKGPPPRGRRVPVVVGLFAAVVAGGFLRINERLFDDEWISRQSWRGAAQAAFLILGGTLVPAAVLVAAASVRVRGRRIFGLVWLAAGATL